jgi:curli biogenesis system outer membrane secretion channel CsgG
VKPPKIIALISILVLMISCAADNVAVQKAKPVKPKKQTPRYTSPDKALDYVGRALIQELQAPANKRKSNLKPMVIALADFVTADGKVTRLGHYVSDKITPYFTRSARFSVQERALIDKVIQEHKFQASAFVDEDSAQEVGKLLGAETIITGTISELSDAYYINAKAVGVTKGNILASIDVEIKNSDKLAALYDADLPQFKKIKTKVFRAQGIGIPSPKHKNPTLARTLAARAAKVVAMRNLAEQIQAVQITADTTIKDMVTQDDNIRIQLNSTVQGARVINQRQLPDGSVEVEMEVELTEEFLKTVQSK